ncbi:hypothetical protein PS900_03494 [Pseudomonas fluorescens]|uniref:Uncharacterized protein n=2 Tax=Pseudomonas fluorescens TaxID=294 RepID=A0A8H2RS43_PSEFL|nr:hypothetical protein PS900_03494 [Pseudomonas fluorescens]
MRYLTLYRSETSSTSTDQVTISSNYLGREDFDLSLPLHGGLHYVFMRGVRMTSYAKGYELRMAINAFLDFTSEYNGAVVPGLRIESLSDVGVEEYAVFEEYLRRNKRRIYLAIRLRSAFKLIARKYDDGMPHLKLRIIEEPVSIPSEPLSDAADQDFYYAMHKEVDRLLDKLKFNEAVATAQPYDKWEVWDICRELYSFRYGQRSSWVIDPVRAAATLKCEGYPFHMRNAHIDACAVDARTSTLSPTGRTPLEFVLSCCIYKGFLRFRAPDSIELVELFKLMFPTSQDQASLAMFIQRQLGWNKETVLALDVNDYLHPISELANDDTVLLLSQKVKSQGQGEPYEKPKATLATSSRSDFYSGYNLIRLAGTLSKQCRDLLKRDVSVEMDDCRLRSPFLFLADPRLPWSPSERIHSLHEQSHWNVGVKGFLTDAKLVDNGVPLLTGADLQNRLRVTSLQSNKKLHKQPVALTALIYGHSNPVTTDTHYDQSVYAMADRIKRFHTFQQSFIEKSQSGQFKGYMADRGTNCVESPRFRILTVMGHERALWACMDSWSPSFPGSQLLPPGARCTRLDKCNSCDKWCVLEDSLPFLMERATTLELQIERDPHAHSIYAGELGVLHYVLDTWGNKSALELAKQYLRRFEALLPLDLKSLVAYIED